ncbi:MAG: hypothetical protein DRJ37_03610 [Thermoprotei archaeon]|nr:MAG: hypothetical protein DRJ37_03610 [Thermoprotei archaeon]
MPEVLSEKMITIAEVKKILEDSMKKGELNSIQLITLEYARSFTKIKEDGIEEVRRFLIEAKGLPEEVAIQIMNIMPKSIEELRTILATVSKTFTTEELTEIINELDKYRKE